MASGSTSIWGRPFPQNSDSPNVATDIQALANSLETVPLFPTTATSSRSGLAGESVVVSPSQTLTLPASPAKGDAIQIIALGTVTGSTPVTVATAGSKVINGVGLTSASSFLLGAPNAHATVQYDGTAWRMIAGQQDTGWVAATPGGTWSGSALIRLTGDQVGCRGVLNATSAGTGGTTVITVPAAMKPPAPTTQRTTGTDNGSDVAIPLVFNSPGTTLTLGANISSGDSVTIDPAMWRIS